MTKRSRQLKPLSSEHHQALLVAFQLKKGLAGHADAAGAPKDLPGLINLARRFQDNFVAMHTRAEEDLLAQYISEADLRRMKFEHNELSRLVAAARRARPAEARQALAAYAELLERHVRWEERDLFEICEAAMDEETLATVGHELERRLVLSKNETPQAAKSNKRA